MCGLVGALGPAARRVEVRAPDLLNSLKHRGPDDEGLWIDKGGNLVLAHTRLAIRDTSQGASQPFFTRSGRSALVYNGEIYNAREIASLLPRRFALRTTGDTEILAEALEALGADVIAQLEGMFSFAFATVDGSSLLLARDRMGEKPLYWLEENGTVFFASELRPLRQLVDRADVINSDVLCEYLTFGYISGPGSLLEGVKQLAPGEYLQFQGASRSSRRYWEASAPRGSEVDSTRTSHDLNFAVDRLEECLLTSVSAVLVSDRAMCLTLSGGVDSTLVCCAAAKLGVSLPAITVRSPSAAGVAEAQLASWTARHLGLDWHAIDIEAKSLDSAWPALRWLDEPLGDSSFLPTLEVCRAIRSSNAVVALGGDGGDELFLGYPHYMFETQTSLSSKIARFGARSLFPLAERMPTGLRGRGWAMRQGAGQIDCLLSRTQSDWQTVGRLMGPEWADASRALLHERFAALVVPAGSSVLNAFDIQHYLPGDILRKTDRAAMSVGLELRSPWLHPRLVDFSLSLPDDLKLLHGLKTLPRLLLRRWLPDSPLSSQPKRGFSIPLGAWIREPPGAESFRHMLNHLPPHVDTRYVSGLLETHAHGRANESRLFSLAALAAWYSDT